MMSKNKLINNTVQGRRNVYVSLERTHEHTYDKSPNNDERESIFACWASVWTECGRFVYIRIGMLAQKEQTDHAETEACSKMMILFQSVQVQACSSCSTQKFYN